MEKVDRQSVEQIKEWVRNEAKGLDAMQSTLLLSMLDMVSTLL